MSESELSLWEDYRRGDETARRELLLSYLPLAELFAKRIARSAGWTNWEDLKQDGAIGLMKAMTKFEPSRGVAFKTFAKPYIHGAILDGSELNRGLARTLEENYRKIRTAEAKLTNILRRNPTREEVAERTKLTLEQIQNAIDAMSAAFASALPESEDSSAANPVGVAQMESALLVQEALSMLSEREAKVVVHYYLEDQSAEQIADALGLTESNVTKIRQRALRKMSRLLDDVNKKA